MNQNHLNAGKAVEELAHLVKNILQVMSSCHDIIDLSLKNKQFDRVAQAFQMEKTSFWRLKKFQLDLINYAKDYPVNRTRIDLLELLAKTAKSLESIAHIPLSLDEQAKPLCVLADPEQLKNCLLQIVVFMFDHFGQENAGICVKTSIAQKNQMAQILFLHQSKALAAEQWKQWENPLEEKNISLCTGLELPVAKKLICAQGGKLLTPPESLYPNCLELQLPCAL